MKQMLLTIGVCTGCAAAGPTSLASSARAQIAAAVPLSPTPFAAGNSSVHLVYELIISNAGDTTVYITQVDALAQPSAGGDSQALASYAGEALRQNVRIAGARAGAVTLGPRKESLVYMFISLASELDVPATITHRIHYASESSAKGGLVFEGGTTSPAQLVTTLLGPPLRGGPWLAGNGPSNDSGHRRTVIAIGKARIPQRFAIDWMKIDAVAKTHHGDPLVNANYYCYGAEVLAVAPATVTAKKDGIPENIPGATSRAVMITLENVGGNHVILDLGEGRYAFYAHLQPGSIKVAEGERVERGQVLGLLGNSGNSTEPHLHFHVGDANSPLGTEGLPYHLDCFELVGRKTDGFASIDFETHKGELPLKDWIVQFRR